MSDLKVLHLIKGLGRGGAERLLAEMPGFAKTTRHEVAYFLPWKDAFVPQLSRQGVATHCLGARNTAECFRLVPSLTRLVRRLRPDVLHCHMPVPSVLGRIAGRITGTPVVSTEHNLLERYHPLSRQASLCTWALQDLVVAVSDEVRASIVRRAGLRVPVEVVRNGVPAHLYGDRSERGAIREMLGFDDSNFVTGTVAVFRSQKRLDVWLDAAARVSQQRPESRFLLVGDGPLKQEVEALVRQRGLDGVVAMPGLRSDVPQFLSAMDAYMMSSDFEGLPVALLEAMSSSLPVVATTVGGIPEAIRHGEEGLLVAPGSGQSLAESLVTLIERPLLRQELGARGLERIHADYGMARMVGELEDLYARVTSRSVQ